ncbi:Fatty acid desaturase [Trichormus variabilis ATCC 29413]|uniref:Fatty acid desaturase n=5 Tax=Anabaena variabilis TaxID=264691 RepID=Q3M693_TRIV2|nr:MULTISPECIES: fatty acid desaturase [Nostocaceae]ABA23493.1 Fatty acid desaturase [Trichormus variabilis ATCC 29413]MBC1216968.1 fatty acid desaturase [Trichormus variabilis ARAD]MBC1258737.1 fatty acid desaturase [Trichormus variabilis V5]MBC1304818.1 fatty acid desaturase [Trichormus variabilis N2B]MBC1328861.1 fatty acid desaturase [Trichormus variabilis 9RC]
MVQCQPSSLRAEKLVLLSSTIRDDKNINKGIFVACFILFLWAISLILLLSIDTSIINQGLLIIAMLWQTFLYTGLFITAHDAMHGVVYPKNPKINNFIGKLTLILYGLFPYKDLLKKHWLHHGHPGTDLDPDYYNGHPQNFFLWYLHFMKSYWRWTQIFGLVMIFHGLKSIVHIPENNLIIFWMIPSILSSVQLFYFGTFLPHKKLEGGYTNPHCARSIPLPLFWSFVTCYHFGYHKEHHEYPQLPWWKLPEAYKISL